MKSERWLEIIQIAQIYKKIKINVLERIRIARVKAKTLLRLCLFGRQFKNIMKQSGKTLYQRQKNKTRQTLSLVTMCCQRESKSKAEETIKKFLKAVSLHFYFTRNNRRTFTRIKKFQQSYRRHLSCFNLRKLNLSKTFWEMTINLLDNYLLKNKKPIKQKSLEGLAEKLH